MLDEFARYSALQRDQAPLASLLIYLKRKGGYVQLNQIWREMGPTGGGPFWNQTTLINKLDKLERLEIVIHGAPHPALAPRRGQEEDQHLLPAQSGHAPLSLHLRHAQDLQGGAGQILLRAGGKAPRSSLRSGRPGLQAAIRWWAGSWMWPWS